MVSTKKFTDTLKISYRKRKFYIPKNTNIVIKVT